MLILVLIDVQYSQKALFSFEKRFHWSKSLLLRFPLPNKKIPQPVKFLVPSPPLLTIVWKTLWTWAGSGLLISMLQKLNLLCLTGPITLVLLIWKWTSLFLRKNHLLKCWGCLSLINWIGAFTLSLLLKLPPGKLEFWFTLWSFFLLRLLCISRNLPYSHVWNTVVTSELVLWIATWNCLIIYKKGYAGLSVFYLLPLLNPWLIVKI